MKKALLVVLLLAVGAGAFFFWKQRETNTSALEFVPANTVAFVELPDLATSRERWKNTALFKILHEPTVQAFLERPRSKIPKSGEVHTQVDRVRRIDPREAFAALTALDGSQFLAGFRFNGKKEDVDSLNNDLKARLQKQWPAAKTDLLSHPAGNIETFTIEKFTLSIVTTKNWWLISDNVELLKSALDRVSGKMHGNEGTLADSDLYKKATAKLAKDPELLIFTAAQQWMDRLLSLMKATGQDLDSTTLARLKGLQAIAGTTRFEGELIRDAFVSIRNGATQEAPMARNSMALTTAQSLAYYAAVLSVDRNFHLPNPALDRSGILQRIENVRLALVNNGVTVEDVEAALGKEIGAILDWPAASPQPSLLVSIDIRDRTRAEKILDLLTNGQAGLPIWGKQQEDGKLLYVLSNANLGILTPALALSDKFLVLGLTLPSVQDGLKRLTAANPKLDSIPAFQTITKTVTPPTRNFAYLDSKGFFEKIYGTARPLMIMYGSFAPGLSEYVDINKLPTVEVISQHLGAITASQSTSAEGDFSESVGTVTFTHAGVFAGVAAGVAIPLAIKNNLIPMPSRAPALPPPSASPAVPMASPAVSPIDPPDPAETQAASPSPAATAEPMATFTP